MVSVTMSADPPRPNLTGPSGIVIFSGTRAEQLRQLHAYMRPIRDAHMATFAEMVLEKGHGAMAPVRYVNGEAVRETWQACGRRLFGKEPFIAAMERAVAAYKATHAEPAEAAPEPPPHVLSDIPDPEF